MRKHHAENERTKRRYVEYLKHAKQLSDTSIDQAAAAIADFEAATNYRDFRKFRIELAQRYKRELGGRVNEKTGKLLAKATISSRLMALKGFFEWLAGQPGFRSKLTYSGAEYFRPSANDERIAKAVREKPVAGVEDIRQVLAAMPAETKGDQLDNLDTAYKRDVLDFMSKNFAWDDTVPAGTLELVQKNGETVEGALILMSEIPTQLPGYLS